MAVITRYYGAPGWLGTVTIDNFEYPCTQYTWNDIRPAIQIYSASSMPFCDSLAGAKNLTLSCSGVVRTSWNPFRRANPPYLGTYISIKFEAVPNSYITPWFAIANYAYVESFNVSDDANGVATWNATFKGNWVFTNWGGTNNN